MISEVGAMVKFDAARARRKLLRLLDGCEGRADRVAVELGVSRRTLDRWIVRLGLSERAAEIRATVGGEKAPE